jgi:hypothetical protein
MGKPEKLYHFTKTETALRYILPKEILSGESRLKMNNIGSMNDPKENLMFVTNIDECIINPIDGYKITGDSYLIANHIRNESYVLCFAVDKNKEGREIKGYQLQRMWSQYGENCSGICIELNYKKFVVENEQLIKEYEIEDDFVKYSHHNFFNIPTPLRGKSAKNNDKENSKCTCEHWKDYKKQRKFITERFFSKNIDWEGESEYRFLTFLEKNSGIFLNITSAIEKVIVGFNFSKHYLPSLENLVDRNKIYLLEMGLDEQFQLRKLYNN